MKEIKNLVDNYNFVNKKSSKTERGELIVEFLDRLNSERGSFKPLSIVRVAYLLSPFNVTDLYILLAKCKQAESFSACFWWHVKI